jgi:Tfp pilus assembly protein PilP
VRARSTWVAAFVMLAGCAAPAAVSDVSDSMVKVRGNQFTPVTELDATAQNACQLYKKEAVKMSQFCVDSQCVYQDTLYVCK